MPPLAMALPTKPGPYQVATPLIEYLVADVGQVVTPGSTGRSDFQGKSTASFATSPPFAIVTSPTLAHGCFTFHSCNTARCNRTMYIGPASTTGDTGRPNKLIASGVL